METEEVTHEEMHALLQKAIDPHKKMANANRKQKKAKQKKTTKDPNVIKSG